MLMKNHEPFYLSLCAQTGGGGWKASPHSIRRGSHPRAPATLDTVPAAGKCKFQQVRRALPFLGAQQGEQPSALAN
jgi:hypothetical protein